MKLTTSDNPELSVNGGIGALKRTLLMLGFTYTTIIPITLLLRISANVLTNPDGNTDEGKLIIGEVLVVPEPLAIIPYILTMLPTLRI